jgi:hypothetical protein
MHHVLDVAISVVAVDEGRQVAGRHDVAHGRRDFAEALQADVGYAITRADDREAANEICLETDALDEPGAERVMGARNNQEPLVIHSLVDDFAKACH